MTAADTTRDRSDRRAIRRAVLLGALPAGYLLVFFVLPILYLLLASLRNPDPSEFIGKGWTLGNYTDVLSDSYYLTILARTFGASAGIVVIALVIGYLIAYRLKSMGPRAQASCLLLFLFPLMVSNVVRAYGWIAILGRNGLLNTGLRGAGYHGPPLSILFSAQAVILGLMTILLPYMIISILNALNTVDTRYREAAASLGASPLRTFIHVTLPLSAPGVLTGTLLVFLLTLSAYITISLLGGPRYKLLVSLVFDTVQNFQWAKAGALAFILLALALVVSSALIFLLRPAQTRKAGGS
jgi:putative spermidine/putrescine transport system permease protein